MDCRFLWAEDTSVVDALSRSLPAGFHPPSWEALRLRVSRGRHGFMNRQRGLCPNEGGEAVPCYARRMSSRCLGPAVLASVLILFGSCAGGRRAESVRAAVCQIEVHASATQNLQTIAAAVAEAAAAGAQIVCFPEACVHGWVNVAAHAEARPIPGAVSDRLSALAREHGVLLVVGMAEREAERLYNSVVLFGADGSVLLRHRKINVLSELMEPPYAAGAKSQRSVVDTPLGRIGLLICADTFREDIVASLAAQKPDLVVVPYGWAAPEERWPEHGKSLQAWVENLARKCGAPVLGVDSTGRLASGPWKGFVLGGQSVVCDGQGQVVDVLPDRRAAVRIFDL